jgi:hypothetical protein
LAALPLASVLAVLLVPHVLLVNMLDLLVLRLHQKQSKDLVPLAPTLQPVASVLQWHVLRWDLWLILLTKGLAQKQPLLLASHLPLVWPVLAVLLLVLASVL